jgi:hypothetical protein
MPRRSREDRLARRHLLATKRDAAHRGARVVEGRLYCAPVTVALTNEDGSTTDIEMNPYTALATIGGAQGAPAIDEDALLVLAGLAFEASGTAQAPGGPQDLDAFIESAQNLVGAGLVGLDERGVGFLMPGTGVQD